MEPGACGIDLKWKAPDLDGKAGKAGKAPLAMQMQEVPRNLDGTGRMRHLRAIGPM